MGDTPWNRYKGDPAEDGDIPDEKLAEARREELKREEKAEDREDLLMKKYVAPRKFKITKADADKHGHTKGCSGCVSWFRGLARQPHTQACRERFETAMKGEAKVAMAEEKQREFKRRIEAKRRPKVEPPKEDEDEDGRRRRGDDRKRRQR